MSDPDETQSSLSISREKKSNAPDFLNETYALPNELTEEFLTILLTENSNFVENLPLGSGSYLKTNVVQYIFTICIRLRIPDDVKYFAIDIFDKFMNIQGIALWDAVARLNRSNKAKYKIWSKIEATLSRQLTLRVVTAIQIASKLHSFHESLAQTDVRKCLQALGFPYTIEAIHKSELRMLKTLNFELNSRRNPAVYMINFLKMLLRSRPEIGEHINGLYRYCIFWLDYTLINRTEVFTRVLSVVHSGNPVKITKDALARVQSDYSLLGCAVIIAALVCLAGPQIAETYIKELSLITTVSEADISDASTGLVRTLLKDKSRFEQ
uniref:Cyclin N-terminal domain-containing protein n=1 Tax=Panagrolaimus superbus TaxID=310955 RepID=A0A914Z5U4_9BILA